MKNQTNKIQIHSEKNIGFKTTIINRLINENDKLPILFELKKLTKPYFIGDTPIFNNILSNKNYSLLRWKMLLSKKINNADNFIILFIIELVSDVNNSHNLQENKKLNNYQIESISFDIMELFIHYKIDELLVFFTMIKKQSLIDEKGNRLKVFDRLDEHYFLECFKAYDLLRNEYCKNDAIQYRSENREPEKKLVDKISSLSGMIGEYKNNYKELKQQK